MASFFTSGGAIVAGSGAAASAGPGAGGSVEPGFSTGSVGGFGPPPPGGGFASRAADWTRRLLLDPQRSLCGQAVVVLLALLQLLGDIRADEQSVAPGRDVVRQREVRLPARALPLPERVDAAGARQADVVLRLLRVGGQVVGVAGFLPGLALALVLDDVSDRELGSRRQGGGRTGHRGDDEVGLLLGLRRLRVGHSRHPVAVCAAVEISDRGRGRIQADGEGAARGRGEAGRTRGLGLGGNDHEHHEGGQQRREHAHARHKALVRPRL